MNSSSLQPPHWVQKLRDLFEKKYARHPEFISVLPASGSDRRYARFHLEGTSMLGAWNPEVKENLSFAHWSSFFSSKGISVPAIYCISDTADAYFCQDLGDITLLQTLLDAKKSSGAPDAGVKQLFKDALEGLAQMVKHGTGEIQTLSHIPAFDNAAMMRDLNYFRYYFLRLSGIHYDESALEDDFSRLVHALSAAPTGYFVFRDFQGRNIMVNDNQPWFIDFQSAITGPLQYDPASLIYQAKAALNPELRNELLEHYVHCLSKEIPVDRSGFYSLFPAMALIRMLQTLGAYGFRGFIQRKDHFLTSIEPALQNLTRFFENEGKDLPYPAIRAVVSSLSEKFSGTQIQDTGTLLVKIKSFSYKAGIPQDNTGNGGGFVFDCRALENPGRYTEYKNLTGLQHEVVEFLRAKSRWEDFMNETTALVAAAADTYSRRGFRNLLVCYGCTGGQHRSVASAEELAKRISNLPGINVELEHTECGNWAINYNGQ